MNKGWLELESDPGLFTLLLEDFGVKGVQVEEIYDLTKSMEGPVYGFIFLFRWIEERRSRRKANPEVESFVTDDDAVNSIFFAQQIIPNSCATHALLSVLLNSSKVTLGHTLTRVKDFTRAMNPEDKGYAIGNMPDLARAHNSHARPEPKQLPEKQSGISTVRSMDSESFHFVSYVPINGHLFELDGLKPYPIDHGPWDKTEDWTEKFRRVITERLGIATSGEPYHDIRFNLMVVVPDKRTLYEQKLSTLRTNHKIVLEAMQQSLQQSSHESSPASIPECMAASVKLSRHSEDKNGAPYREDKSGTPYREDKSGPPYREDKSGPPSSVETLSLRTESESSTEASQTSLVSNTSTSGDKPEPSLADVKVKVEPSFPDVTTPLTIETKFGGLTSEGVTSSGPSSESTDTASEVGSGFSSPTSSQSSPNMHPGEDSGSKESRDRKRKHRSSHQAFTPKNLLDLLKNVESEMEVCEGNLKEEVEKRKKYKIDDCRRTHNYDAFITTFLTMLAEQGHLADLVSDNLAVARRPGPTPTTTRPKHTSPSPATPRAIAKTTTPPPQARRKPRPKRRR